MAERKPPRKMQNDRTIRQGVPASAVPKPKAPSMTKAAAAAEPATVPRPQATPKGGRPMAETARKPKLSSFEATFAANRKAGKKTFEWNGKKYTTKLKSEK